MIDKPVFTTRQADLQILEIDTWWRENRDKAPDLFEEELAELSQRSRSDDAPRPPRE